MLYLQRNLALGAAAIVLAAHRSYFTTDDHVFFAQDAETSFGLRFLTEPIYDHFSPWHSPPFCSSSRI